MVILGLKIAAFGKLNDKEIPLRPGTNVITGENESGKTTVAVFLKSMLYGMENAGNTYERYYPFGFEGVYGGSMRVLVDDKTYMISRSFLKSNTDLKVVDLSNGQEIKDPEGWLNEIRGGLNLSEYEASGFIAQNALVADVKYLEENASLNEAEQKESANRAYCIQARAELLKRKKDLEARVDDGLQQKALNVLRVREEKVIQMKTLEGTRIMFRHQAEEGQKALDQEIKRANEINSKKAAQLHRIMNEKKSRLSEYAEFNERELKKSSVPGIVLIALGILLAAVAGFLFSSYHMEGQYRIPTLAGAAAALILIIAGLVFTVIRVSRKNIALLRRDTELQYRDEALDAENEYQYFIDHMNEVGEVVSDRAAREAEIGVAKQKLVEMNEKFEEISKECRVLDDEKEKYTVLLEEQEEIHKELSAVNEAAVSVAKLGRLRDDMTDPGFGEIAESWIRRLSRRDEDHLSVEADGKINYSGEGASLVPYRMNNSRAQEISLALRLTLLTSLDPDNRLPLILDDTFTDFDEKRLDGLMDAMKQDSRQVIVLSCRSREKDNL